ncbi:MAG: hypothetical protein J0M29_07480 [Chitinophagales bacterium]|nr:hypothetical protein [Chitinophagales bacterium]
MKHIFFSILSILAFIQCKEAPAPPKHVLQCYVRYDAASRNVKAEATLRDAVSKNILDIPGGIQFQATAMKLIPVMGNTYTLEFPAAFTPKVDFEWNNAKQKKGIFQLDMPAIDSFFFSSAKLSVKEPTFLQWRGEALSAAETLVFMWEKADGSNTVPMEVSTTLGKPLIEIPAAKLAQLGAGEWKLYLVRKRAGKADNPDYAVEYAAEYYTKQKTIVIE